MVAIRTLQPSVRIALPEKRQFRRPSNVKRDYVRRSLREFPPPTPQPTPCRLWQGSLDGNGYGKRKMKQADGSWRMISVHRWVMETVLGRRLGKREVILHACDQPLCYALDHLSVGTMASNNADARRKGRAKKPPVNRLRGEANGRNKIPPRLWPKIMDAWLDGATMPSLARLYGVHPATINKILKQTPLPQRDRYPPHARRRAEQPLRPRREAQPERTKPVKEDDVDPAVDVAGNGP